MKVKFSKYQGTGNDFIIIDNRTNSYNELSVAQIRFLCDRRFGIGADGLLQVLSSKDYDFTMRYYNSDGNESTMCGNGGRCITQHAHRLGIISNKARFESIDGIHESSILNNRVKLLMSDVSVIDWEAEYFCLNTGSPHYVTFTENVQDFNVVKEGRKIRNSEPFREKGINVDFVEICKENLFVRTYERGVEDETLSCGTGVIASAIAATYEKPTGNYLINVDTLGGKLSVSFEKLGIVNYKNIYLEGPAEFVFEGEIEV